MVRQVNAVLCSEVGSYSTIHCCLYDQSVPTTGELLLFYQPQLRVYWRGKVCPVFLWRCRNTIVIWPLFIFRLEVFGEIMQLVISTANEGDWDHSLTVTQPCRERADLKEKAVCLCKSSYANSFFHFAGKCSDDIAHTGPVALAMLKQEPYLSRIQSPTGLHSHSHAYVFYLCPARFRVLMKQQFVCERETEATRLISTVSHLSKVLSVFRILSDSGNTSMFYLYWALLWRLLPAQHWQPIGRQGCY